MSWDLNTRVSNLEVSVAYNPAIRDLDMNGYAIINFDLSGVDLSGETLTNATLNNPTINNGNFLSGNITATSGAFNNISTGTISVSSSLTMNPIAIGSNAGQTNQSLNSIAIGTDAGQSNQSTNSIAIGHNAGESNQSTSAISIGFNAGSCNQSHDTVAIGHNAGFNGQNEHSIAIGRDAGRSNQGSNAIAIGYYAGRTNQGSNSIAINASLTDLSASANSLYINPIRNSTGSSNQFNSLYYNATSKEVSYLPNEYINVKTYGAVGDGVTDDTTAIQNCMNANGGNVIFFPEGVYAISSALDLSGVSNVNNTIFVGVGASVYDTFITAGSSTILQTSNSANILNIRPTTINDNRINGVSLRNLSFAYKTPLSVTSGTALTISRSWYFNIDNVIISQAYKGIVFNGCHYANVSNVEYYGTRKPLDISGTIIEINSDYYLTAGIPTYAYGYTIFFNNCYFTSGFGAGFEFFKRYSLKITAGDGICFNNCYFGGATEANVYMKAGQGTAPVGGSQYDNIVNTRFNNCYMDVYANGTPIGLKIEHEPDISSSITGIFLTNTFINYTQNGIYVDYPQLGFREPSINIDNCSIQPFTGGAVISYPNQSAIKAFGGARSHFQISNSKLAADLSGFCIDVSGIFSLQSTGNLLLPDTGGCIYYSGTNTSMTLVGNMVQAANSSVPDLSFNTGATISNFSFSGNQSQYTGNNNFSGIKQSETPISIGVTSGCNSQGPSAIAIGTNSGFTGQDSNAIAIGSNAGQTNQRSNAVAIGRLTGSSNQGTNAIAIGFTAGFTNQGTNAVAIGVTAGSNNQGSNSIAIGNLSGLSNQGTNAVAIGSQAGQTAQGTNAIAIGRTAGSSNQGVNSVGVGVNAGGNNQGTNAVAVGVNAGNSGQGSNAIAIGSSAGQCNQGTTAIAIGFQAGTSGQGSNAIAIGSNAGRTGQSNNCIAIGALAGQTGQLNNTIIINALGTDVSSIDANACYIAPIRNATFTNSLGYDVNSREVVYSSKTFVIDHPTDKNKYLQHACLEGAEAGVYYRGQAIITNKEFVLVKIPEYVNKIASELTVYATRIYDGKLRHCGVSQVFNNSFMIYSDDNGEFNWVLYGKRLNIEVEPSKEEYELKRSNEDSPYTYLVKK